METVIHFNFKEIMSFFDQFNHKPKRLFARKRAFKHPFILQLDDCDEAIEICEKITKACCGKESARLARYLIGEIYCAFERYHEGMYAFKEYLMLYPDNYADIDIFLEKLKLDTKNRE